MSAAVFQQIEALLTQRGVAYEVLRHAPVYTSEEAARVRGTPLASGAKALICKGDASLRGGAARAGWAGGRGCSCSPGRLSRSENGRPRRTTARGA